MKHPFPGYSAVLLFCLLVSLPLTAQQLKPGLVDAESLKRAVPPSSFFRGQSATVQRATQRIQHGRQQTGSGWPGGQAGYASEVAAKYQGFSSRKYSRSRERDCRPASMASASRRMASLR